MKPFENDAEVLTLKGLSVENGIDAVTLVGSLDFSRDRESLRYARRLREILDGVISAIEEAGDLPETAKRAVKAAERKSNPLRPA